VVAAAANACAAASNGEGSLAREGSVASGGVMNETALGFVVVVLVIAVLIVLAREGVLINAIFNLMWTGE
jgi:hypothetical protein